MQKKSKKSKNLKIKPSGTVSCSAILTHQLSGEKRKTFVHFHFFFFFMNQRYDFIYYEGIIKFYKLKCGYGPIENERYFY